MVEQEETIQYTTYATDPMDFQTWVDRIHNTLKLPSIVLALLLGVVLYLGGYLISLAIDFEGVYVRTIPVYLGTIGVPWIMLITRYGSVSFHNAYEVLRPCFLISDNEYVPFIKEWGKRFANFRGNMIAGVIYFFLILPFVVIAFYGEDLMIKLSIISLRAQAFPAEWFSLPPLWVKMCIGIWFGVACSPLLATGARLLILNVRFLLDISRFPVVPLSDVVRSRLRPITNLYLTVAFCWFIGVAMIGILFSSSMDAISIIVIVGLSIIGLLTFLVPQFVYRSFLMQSANLSNQWVMASFYRRFGITLAERPSSLRRDYVERESGIRLAEMSDLAGFMDASAPAEFWVYNPSDVVLLFIGQAIAIASLFVEGIVF